MISHDRLLEVLEYLPEEGLFYWRKTLSVTGRAGFLAGCKRGGYVYIGVDNRAYLAHRLAWLYIYKVWPTYPLDHIDGNGMNNKLNNLRDVPPMINSQNIRKSHKDNVTGLLGVRVCGNKWQSRIRVNGQDLHLGSFHTPEEAHEAYLAAKRLLHQGNTL